VEQVKLRLLQVSFVFIIFYFLSTISFSLQLHLKKPWVRGKSLRGFSLAAMTALLMSCSPTGPRCCPSTTTCWTSRQWGRKRSPTCLQYQNGEIQWKMLGRGNRFHSSGCGQIWWMAQGLIGGYHQAGEALWEVGGGDNEATERLGGLFGRNSAAQYRTQVNNHPSCDRCLRTVHSTLMMGTWGKVGRFWILFITRVTGSILFQLKDCGRGCIEGRNKIRVSVNF